MKTIVWIFILLVGLANVIYAPASETNATFDLLSFTNAQSTNSVKLLPLIRIEDVPITSVIENLARQMDMNYLIDPELFPISESRPEPIVTFTLKNVTARDVLTRMLNLRHIVMLEDHVTGVMRITRAGQPVRVMDASLLGMDTNNLVPSSKDLIPLIQFADVPLRVALENLARQGDLNVVFDPVISGIGDPLFVTPILSVRWQNITATQAFIAVCQNYDLIAVKDSATGVIQIQPEEGKGHHRLQSK